MCSHNWNVKKKVKTNSLSKCQHRKEDLKHTFDVPISKKSENKTFFIRLLTCGSWNPFWTEIEKGYLPHLTFFIYFKKSSKFFQFFFKFFSSTFTFSDIPFHPDTTREIFYWNFFLKNSYSRIAQNIRKVHISL